MVSPYPQVVEIEGELTEIGTSPAGDDILITTPNGPVRITGLDEMDLAGLVPGVFGLVRITIDPIGEPSIDTPTEYDVAVERAADLDIGRPAPDSPEERELNRLNRAIKTYEEKRAQPKR